MPGWLSRLILRLFVFALGRDLVRVKGLDPTLGSELPVCCPSPSALSPQNNNKRNLIEYYCSGWNSVPASPIHIHLEPQNVTWFRDRVFEDVINYGSSDEIILDLELPRNPVTWNLQKKGEGDVDPKAHREEGHGQPETKIKAMLPQEGMIFRLQVSRIRRRNCCQPSSFW